MKQSGIYLSKNIHRIELSATVGQNAIAGYWVKKCDPFLSCHRLSEVGLEVIEQSTQDDLARFMDECKFKFKYSWSSSSMFVNIWQCLIVIAFWSHKCSRTFWNTLSLINPHLLRLALFQISIQISRTSQNRAVLFLSRDHRGLTEQGSIALFDYFIFWCYGSLCFWLLCSAFFGLFGKLRMLVFKTNSFVLKCQLPGIYL